MIQFLCGLPGKGKGILATREAIKYHAHRATKKALKKANELLPEDNQLQTLVFSNYPILLDMKKNIYSNYVSFEYLTTEAYMTFGFPAG